MTQLDSNHFPKGVFRVHDGQKKKLVEELIRECAHPGIDNFDRIDALVERLRRKGKDKIRLVKS